MTRPAPTNAPSTLPSPSGRRTSGECGAGGLLLLDAAEPQSSPLLPGQGKGGCVALWCPQRLVVGALADRSPEILNLTDRTETSPAVLADPGRGVSPLSRARARRTVSRVPPRYLSAGQGTGVGLIARARVEGSRKSRNPGPS